MSVTNFTDEIVYIKLTNPHNQKVISEELSSGSKLDVILDGPRELIVTTKYGRWEGLITDGDIKVEKKHDGGIEVKLGDYTVPETKNNKNSINYSIWFILIMMIILFLLCYFIRG